MEMQYPHLDDTSFPSLETVDVYKYKNDFNYERWQGNIKIKLCNVLWNTNYTDVPGFESNKERDEFFDNIKGLSKEFESKFNKTPKTDIRVPIPYNAAVNYNYIVIEMPAQTSGTEMIDYYDIKETVNKWFYFITDAVQYSPSTTEYMLQLDYWTTYFNTIDIPYLMLERGHAPMMQTSVDKYLSNPIENNEYLLAQDFNYGNMDKNVIATSSYVPINAGKKYVLFAAPYSEQDFALFGGAEYSGNATPPTYENANVRHGYQFIVNGYQWKYGNGDYTNANLPIEPFMTQDYLVYNGNCCYAIEANQADDFFNLIALKYVHVIHGIQACFILDESMFNRLDSFTFHGFTLYTCAHNEITSKLSFDKKAFGFDKKYAEITKLYTNPYSHIEITDDNGNSFNVNIENCGDLKMHTNISLSYPWIRYNVFFSGIDGSGEFKYTWRNMNNANVQKTMWESEFSKYMMNWDIPTYAIYISAENEFAANNAANMYARRARALKDYYNNTQFANTNRENTADTMSTNVANVARTGVMLNENQATRNAADITITAENVDCAADVMSNNNTANATITSINIDKLEADYQVDNDVLFNTTQTNNYYAAMSGVVNAGASIGSGMMNAGAAAMSGAATGAAAGPEGAAGGAAIGGGLSIAGGFLNAACTGASTFIGISNAMDITQIMAAANTSKTSNATTATRDINTETRDANRANTNRANDAATNNTNTNTAANAAMTANTVATNNANMQATANTETANATYLRQANVDAGKRNLVQAQVEAEMAYKNARLQRPVMQGKHSGDAYPDIWQRRGVRINIKTQTKSAIAQAGDLMLRFGYALHRVWDISKGLNYGKHFTYWKAEDIWINDGSGSVNEVTDIIGSILMNGITVWKNPAEIGKVSIYDNI